MGVLANHVPSIEQLKPGLVEIIEESGGTKQFFRKWDHQPTFGVICSFICLLFWLSVYIGTYITGGPLLICVIDSLRRFRGCAARLAAHHQRR